MVLVYLSYIYHFFVIDKQKVFEDCSSIVKEQVEQNIGGISGFLIKSRPIFHCYRSPCVRGICSSMLISQGHIAHSNQNLHLLDLKLRSKPNWFLRCSSFIFLELKLSQTGPNLPSLQSTLGDLSKRKKIHQRNIIQCNLQKKYRFVRQFFIPWKPQVDEKNK